MNLAQLIDHTLLKAEATRAQIEQLCREAREHHFAAVCVQPCRVELAAALVRGADVQVATVAGFPLGANRPATKVAETRAVITAGATEVDMVLNLGALKDGDDALVRDDIAGVAAACHAGGALCKVILETCLLTDDEKARACRLCVEAKADFVKTSTGLSTGGATVADIELMSRLVKPHGLGVKASGGIRSLADVRAMVAAGATRIGTSAGVKIMQEATGR
jgi:deoxyribose-phosphate aldolase